MLCTSCATRVIENSSNIMLTSQGSSRATAYHDSDKMVNTKDYLFVTYLEHFNGAEKVVVKRFNKKTSIWDEEYTFKNVKDNHGGGALVIDSKGFIHIIYGSHNSPLRYNKSNESYSVASWGELEILKGNYTYPSLAIDKNDNLYLVVRKDVRKSNWSLELLKRNATNDSWGSAKTILVSNYKNWRNKSFKEEDFSVSNGYVRFGKYLSVSEFNTLHLTFHYFEYVPKGVKTFSNIKNNSSTYLVGHIFSEDGGNTWVGGNSRVAKENLQIGEVNLIDGDFNPELAKSNFSAGQHVTDGSKIHFLYSKHYGKYTKQYIASSDYPYRTWNKHEIIHPQFYLRAPGSISLKGDTLFFNLNAIPKDIADNRLGRDLSLHSKIITGKINTDLTGNLDFFENYYVEYPSWLPQMSKSGEDLWIMFTQGKRNSNSTRVHTIKIN